MSLDELLVAIRADDSPANRRAFADALYDALRPIFRRTFPIGEAEDLVQGTLVVILRQLDDFEHRGPGSFETWVRTIAYRVMLTARRSRARERGRRIDSPPIMLAQGTNISEAVERRLWVALVISEAYSLDPTLRRAIRDWLMGPDWRELVEREGVARGTLRSRVHRAFAKLRALVQQKAPRAFAPEPSTT